MGRLAYREITPKTSITAANDDGVELIDIKGFEYISQLNLNCAIIATDTNDMGTPVYLVVNKLEIVGNGNQILKSYSPQQCRAIAQINGVDLMSLGYYARDGTDDKSFWNFPVMFGRYPGDPKYMLDTNAWESLQARITWNAADESHDGSTYDKTASPEFRYSADALVYEGGAPSGCKGYIKSGEINRYIMASNKRFPTEVPRGYPLRGLMVRAAYTDTQWWNYFDRMKLDFDNGAWTPVDVEDRQIPSLLALWGQRAGRAFVYTDIGGNDDFDTQFGLVTGFSHMEASATPLTCSLNHAPPFGLTDMISGTTTGTNSNSLYGRGINTWGMMPHQCIYIPMWMFAEIGEDAVPTTGYKRIDFEHKTDGSAGAGLGSVTAEYLVPQGGA